MMEVCEGDVSLLKNSEGSQGFNLEAQLSLVVSKASFAEQTSLRGTRRL